jgi:hypothetical protein
MSVLVNLSPFLFLLAFLWLALRANRKFRRVSQMGAVPAHFENLVPLAAYDVDETGYWRRLPWLSGLFFGASMACVNLFALIPNTRYSPPTTALLSFAICGPGFGLLFPPVARRQLRAVWAGLYAGERRMISPPPSSRSFYYQVPCTSVRGRMGIMGVLYLGREGLLFTARKRRWKPAPSIEMNPLDVVRVALVPPPPQNVIQRLLVPRPPEQIQISWNGTNAGFIVPSPADTYFRLGRSLEALRSIPK